MWNRSKITIHGLIEEKHIHLFVRTIGAISVVGVFCFNCHNPNFNYTSKTQTNAFYVWTFLFLRSSMLRVVVSSLDVSFDLFYPLGHPQPILIRELLLCSIRFFDRCKSTRKNNEHTWKFRLNHWLTSMRSKNKRERQPDRTVLRRNWMKAWQKHWCTSVFF